ncbi:unnamed protein product [Lactuca virosa]|uniref:Uncharacterized protein n=1 Tax=Lactuca virosa TaxID=75947 RepID=A0AAU9PA88_9ASTR|nr:unnamed protein product [Lactuca virosa]
MLMWLNYLRGLKIASMQMLLVLRKKRKCLMLFLLDEKIMLLGASYSLNFKDQLTFSSEEGGRLEDDGGRLEDDGGQQQRYGGR